MLEFNPDFNRMGSGLYKLIISANLGYGGEKHSDYSAVKPSLEVSYEFNLGSCVVTRVYDASKDQIAASGSTMLTYFMNNGTETHKSPFDGSIKFEPDCGPNF